MSWLIAYGIIGVITSVIFAVAEWLDADDDGFWFTVAVIVAVGAFWPLTWAFAGYMIWEDERRK